MGNRALTTTWLMVGLLVNPSKCWLTTTLTATANPRLAATPARRPALTRLYSTTSLGSNEDAWKFEGERIIKKAAQDAGANPEFVGVEWKAGSLIVTVQAEALVVDDEAQGDSKDDADDDESSKDDNEILALDDTLGEGNSEDDVDIDGLDEVDVDALDEEEESAEATIFSIGKAINRAFDDEGEGTVGYNIAVHHSIEVTTPGASDKLSGIMFESYKGFDVILEFKDAKTGKQKKVEGKLMEKGNEFTRINEKGRMRKFKNELVVRVTLPKAKAEKGGGGPKRTKRSKKKRK